MREPPAIAWPIVDDRRWRAVQSVLWTVATAAVSAWIGQYLDDRAAVAAWAAAAGALAGAGLGWRSGRQPPGEIRWTGSQWRWCPHRGDEQRITAPEVIVDLQDWMLLRWRAFEGGAYRWCSAGRAGATTRPGLAEGAVPWTAFRAAVYSAASRSDGRSGPESPSP